MTSLSDTQAVLLSAAAQRDNGSLLPLPASLRPGGGIAKAITALLNRGFAEECETIDASATRRTDGDIRYGVFVTDAGRFTRGQLYLILKNVIYAGRIAHRGVIHPGQHEAIIDEATFAAVQASLTANVQGARTRARAASPSLLAGKIVDTAGELLIATHAVKGKVRHRYYVSQSLHHGRSDTGMRLPAREIEGLVMAQLVDFLADPLALSAATGFDLSFDDIAAYHDRCASLSAALGDHRSPTLMQLTRQVACAHVQPACR